MAGPVIYDEIFNRYFKTQVVTIAEDGYVVGNNPDSSLNQKVQFIDKGDNKFAIQVFSTGAYVVAKGNYVFGDSSEEYTWHLVPRSSPVSGYYFETTHERRAWYLPSDTNGTRIELKAVKDLVSSEDEEKAEWVYERE